MDNKKTDIHVVSYKKHITVWVALLLLTGLTVFVAGVDLGNINILAAMLIASFKMLLVLVFFMHLIYEGRVFMLMVFFTLLTLAIFIGFTFFDISFR